ncbi:cyclase family protein [Mycoplasmatota bacterium WC44]
MKYIDLSHEFREDMTLYPGSSKPIIEQVSNIETDGFNQLELSFTNHIGTHLDVQAHVIKGGKKITDYDISSFQGKGKIFDCRNVEEIGKDVFEDKLTDVDFVLIWTDYGKRFYNKDYMDNYPVLNKEGIDYIISNNVKGVGIDYISVDPINTSDMFVHKQLLRNDVIIYENLCNLHLLENTEFKFMGFPIQISGDGIPVRAVAEIK